MKTKTKQYNKYMSGLEWQDQMLSYFLCGKKTIQWHKRTGVHIFQMTLHAHNLHCKYFGEKTLTE
jgi:hypothetical protein